MKVVLKIRKENKSWIFDDPTFGIKKEPFVMGTSELIDVIKQKKKIKKEELEIIASDVAFEGCKKTVLLHHDKETKWSKYFSKDYGDHFLCPVLLTYFKEPPKELYFDLV